jgi:hypothetical protein
MFVFRLLSLNYLGKIQHKIPHLRYSAVMKPENDYIDIFKAVGKQEYVIYKNDYREELKNNPLVNGLWTVGRWFSFVANTHSWELEFVAGDSKEAVGYTH